MKALLISAFVVTSVALVTQASAAPGRWCAMSAAGGMDCHFATYRQCMAGLHDTGGRCQRNPDYGHAQYLRY